MKVLDDDGSPWSPGASVSPDYLGDTASQESGGKISARSKTSHASGLYGFMPDTARDVLAKHPEIAQIPTEKGRQDAMALAYAEQNADILRSRGIPVNDANVYMTHFLGSGAGPRFLELMKEKPDANASIFFPKEANANPTIFYDNGRPRTLSEVYALQTRRFQDNALGQPQPVTSYAGYAGPGKTAGLESVGAALAPQPKGEELPAGLEPLPQGLEPVKDGQKAAAEEALPPGLEPVKPVVPIAKPKESDNWLKQARRGEVPTGALDELVKLIIPHVVRGAPLDPSKRPGVEEINKMAEQAGSDVAGIASGIPSMVTGAGELAGFVGMPDVAQEAARYSKELKSIGSKEGQEVGRAVAAYPILGGALERGAEALGIGGKEFLQKTLGRYAEPEAREAARESMQAAEAAYKEKSPSLLGESARAAVRGAEVGAIEPTGEERAGARTGQKITHALEGAAAAGLPTFALGGAARLPGFAREYTGKETAAAGKKFAEELEGKIGVKEAQEIEP